MGNKELREQIEKYLLADGLTRDRIYRTNIHPFFEGLIDGVFGSLKISEFERSDYEDIKQEIRIKLLTTILDEATLNKMKNVRSYCFILVRNAAVDCMRKQNTYNKYFELRDTFYEEDEDGEMED